jgi:hypothetical protein
VVSTAPLTAASIKLQLRNFAKKGGVGLLILSCILIKDQNLKVKKWFTRQVIGKAVGQNPGFIHPAFPSSRPIVFRTLLSFRLSVFFPTGNGVPAETITPAKPSTKTAGSVLSGWWLAFTKTHKVREERLPG